MLKKQEASSEKKTSDEEQQIIVGIFFKYYNRGSLNEAHFTPEILTVSLSKSRPHYM